MSENKRVQDGIGVIDLMLSIPQRNQSETYDFMKPGFMDKESLNQMKFPAEYMFRNVPKPEECDDYVQYTIDQMDKHGIQRASLGINDEHSKTTLEAIERFPDRFFTIYGGAQPMRGMDEVRKIKQLKKDYDIKAISVFPAGMYPQVALNDAKMYPLYATCVELDIAFLSTAGVPGPRLPLAPQKVELIDEVCWFFPELRFVMQHGAEPWEKLAWKLMLKYPNLYFMTSAFAPKHYPKEIVDFANSRGADKIMYAGYFPMGLSLDRIFEEMQNVPFKDHVWPKFFKENAEKVYKLESL